MSEPVTIRLHRFIAGHFDLEELRQLCFALGLKYDDLRGEGCAHKARELVSLVERQRQLPHLSAALRQARPELYAQAKLSSAAAALHALCPPAPPHPFIGRQETLRQLTQALRTQRGAVHTLAGLGGVGKTALAAQAARQVGGDFPGGVLWLSLETGPKSAETLWTQIADAYGLPPSLDAAGNARAALERHAPLLVVDDAESAPGVARELLAGRGAATILLTTRDKRVAVGYGRPQDIAPLPRAEAVELFYAQAGPGE
ncbi:MAG: NB-ARC domain-containing protein, partial [Anaerolineae bacterium]